MHRAETSGKHSYCPLPG